MSEGEFPLDNPMLVRWEFASEERLEKRNALFRQLIDGVNAEDIAFEAVREFAPARMLEVGCGAGALSARVVEEIGSEVIAIDTSQRMVDLTRERGVDARVADICALPFADGEFDCVAAGWVISTLQTAIPRSRSVPVCCDRAAGSSHRRSPTRTSQTSGTSSARRRYGR
jgi:SAM-dependent methyltransferase